MSQKRSRSDVGVVALVGHEWSEWTGPHEILTRLAAYFNVVWVNPPHQRHQIVERLRDPEVVIEGKDWPEGFRVYIPEPLLPQLYRPRWLAQLVFRIRMLRACRILHRMGSRQIVLYIWRPSLGDAAGFALHDLLCYHIDDEYTFSTIDLPTPEEERALIEQADCVFMASRAMLEKKGNINPSTYLAPNGVDYRLYSSGYSEPDDLKPIPHPRIGYTGYIKRQLDWPLLEKLARRRPDWSMVFVGSPRRHKKIAKIQQQLTRLGNVHFLGGKPVEALAAYPQHFDVCMMPYEVNDYTKYISPLKLYEYLASGKPVVSSGIPAVAEFDEMLEVASGVEEWDAALERSLKRDNLSGENVSRRRAAARGHDWDVIIERIANTMLRKLKDKGAQAHE